MFQREGKPFPKNLLVAGTQKAVGLLVGIAQRHLEVVVGASVFIPQAPHVGNSAKRSRYLGEHPDPDVLDCTVSLVRLALSLSLDP